MKERLILVNKVDILCRDKMETSSFEATQISGGGRFPHTQERGPATLYHG